MKDIASLSFDVALLLAGVVLLLLGLLGRIRVKDLEIGTGSRVIRCVLAVLGVMLIALALGLQDWRRERIVTGEKVTLAQLARYTVREKHIYQVRDGERLIELVCLDVLARDRKVIFKVGLVHSQVAPIALEIAVHETKPATIDGVTYMFRIEDVANVAIGEDSAEVSVWRAAEGA